ncbi:MFS transporter [Sutterella sp.]|uniref:MFS transporter n=1 Tax=Sutterella sp. TaxID=1981025 RepID=UPI0026DEF401|nr:MFS transporter [Sutterella sp.]MDO5532438.1 MFS transporter [Sutterella sp.]
MSAETEKPSRPLIPRTVWALGFVSLLMDVSSEMIHALLPIFMAGTLGASAMMIGLVEGLGESAALIAKVFSGVLADRFGHRKLLVLIGYGLGVLSKPVFALADQIGVVLAARFFDRIGKGVRGAPRDAIVASVTPKEIWGAAYGLRQSLDAAGAFAGPALATLCLLFFTDDLRTIFWLALIPGALCILTIILGVENADGPTGKPAKAAPSGFMDFLRISSPAFRQVVILGALFSLARFSNAFLVLRAADSGIPTAAVPMLVVGMNVVYSLSCYPIGKLADRMEPVHLLGIGLVALAAADAVLALFATPAGVLAGMALWGLHLGATQGVFSLLIAESAPEEKRATAFGIFNFASGAAILLAGLCAGFLWDRIGAEATFWGGAVFALAALLFTLRLRRSESL